MKIPVKKSQEARRGDDDSLFGLLSSYKSYNTYVSLFFSEDEDSVIVFLTDNPKKWSMMTDAKYSSFRPLSRLKAGLPRLSVKYMLPEHLVKSIGPMLGMKLPTNRVAIINNIAATAASFSRPRRNFFLRFCRTSGKSPCRHRRNARCWKMPGRNT